MDAPLQILAEPRRQEILRLIWDRERCAGEIAADVAVSFSAVSQHLSKLLTADLVIMRRQGRQHFYRANKDSMGPLVQYLEHFWGERLLVLKRLAENEER